ncbi:hypothetical protein [Marinibacterium sp. SX1]|uniref:hypothetical protein n=1 Tax=Marinibacterium sp. SX1 TaxID=3388424 RepID=UPI003D16811C
MTNHHLGRDIILAAAVTMLGAALAYALCGGLPLIGIDDAAITRSYSENIARGAGYVYNVGGERVEGSTTLLWTMILAGFYALTPSPEPLIVLTAGLLTLGAVLAGLRIARVVTGELDGPADLAVGILAVLLLASPGYFLWTVWTMMELALWSAVTLWLVAHLAIRVEAGAPSGPGIGLFLPALLMPMIRPEGVAVAVGLVVLGILLAPGAWRRGVIALGLSLAAFVAVTWFRLEYFGQPFPNTFYAKVSSDRMQDLVDGAKYAISFLLGAPFVEIYLAGWACAAVWALARLFRGEQAGRGLLIPAAAVFGLLSVYAALGGDHFALWRFYQPMTPILPAALAIGAAMAIGILVDRVAGRRLWMALPAGAAALVVLVSGWLHYYQSRFDVVKEFTLVEQGLAFGSYLNGIEPRPSIGVGPAGGIALGYDGYIYDLLGLNWTEMAHANPIKVGMRNHASFDKPTFWEHRPDVLATFNRPCSERGSQSFWAANDDAFDGLFEDQRFRDEFTPVQFFDGSSCWPGFAVPGWLETVGARDSIEVLSWSDVTLLN